MRSPELRKLREDVRQRRTRIAIDGPAASGKSTVGRALSEALGCTFIDTGLMYRAVALRGLQRGLPADDEAALAAVAASVNFGLDPDRRDSLLCDGKSIGPEVRTPAVDDVVSRVAAHPSVRRVMASRQRELARRGCVVMAGRDIGTVVLRDAPVKLWVTASEAERTRRRLADQEAAGASAESVARGLQLRDRRDSTRAASPLVKAEEAVEVCTDGLTRQQSLDAALAAISRLLRPEAYAEDAPTTTAARPDGVPR